MGGSVKSRSKEFLNNILRKNCSTSPLIYLLEVFLIFLTVQINTASIPPLILFCHPAV